MIERVTLRWPGPLGAQSGKGIACSVPGLSVLDGTGDKAGAAFPVADSFATYLQTYDQSAQKVLLSKRSNGDGPVTAICIAPDSAIQSCDIALFGQNGDLQRHRVSPGNPLVGIGEHDWALVTVPNCPPIISAIAGGGVSSKALLWDSVLGQTALAGFPLRLELWRGVNPPIRSPYRAPYYGHVIAALGSSDTRDIIFCVDGRQRIWLDVYNGGAQTITVKAFAGEAIKSNADVQLDLAVETQLALDTTGSTSLTVATTVNLPLDFTGSPMTLLRCNLSNTTASTPIQVKLRAWDW